MKTAARILFYTIFLLKTLFIYFVFAILPQIYSEKETKTTFGCKSLSFVHINCILVVINLKYRNMRVSWLSCYNSHS